MRLLADTDVLCKLMATGLLEAAADLLGAKASAVERLPALPHMLRRGKSLRRMLGDELANRLAPLAEALPQVPVPPPEVAALLAGKDNIDPGEVQLFAVTADEALLLLSGDKRALQAVAREDAVVSKLAGKIVCLEAILLALCKKLGSDAVRAAVRPQERLDKVFSICFAPGTRVPEECLGSYLRNLQSAVTPLVLWMPAGGAP